MTNHALLVAFGDYKFVPKLRSAQSNIGVLEAALRRADGTEHAYTFHTPLVDAEPREIAQAIIDLTKGKREQDRLLLYVMGHGHVDENADNFWILGTEWSPEGQLPQDTISFHDGIWKHMQVSKAGSKALILDCCYSGFSEVIARNGAPIPKLKVEKQSHEELNRLKMFEKNKQIGKEKQNDTLILRSSAATQPSFQYRSGDTEDDVIWQKVCKTLNAEAADPVTFMAKNLATTACIKLIDDQTLSRLDIGHVQKTNLSQARNQAEVDDHGFVSLGDTKDTINRLLPNETKDQKSDVIGSVQAAKEFPLFRIETNSRLEKLAELLEFAKTIEGLSERADTKLNKFLTLAPKTPKALRLSSNLELEKKLWEALQTRGKVTFAEQFLSHDFEAEVFRERGATEKRLREEIMETLGQKDKEIDDLVEKEKNLERNYITSRKNLHRNWATGVVLAVALIGSLLAFWAVPTLMENDGVYRMPSSQAGNE